MTLSTHVTLTEIGRRGFHSRTVEPDASTPQARTRGSLYVFLDIEGTGAGYTRLARQVLNAIQSTYYEQGVGPIGQSLTQALLEAHALVQRANSNEATWKGRAACLVVRGEDLYITRAGPTLAFLAHPDAVDQFPAEVDPAEPCLGDATAPVIDSFQTRLRGDTTLLFVGAPWLEHVPPTTLAAVAAAPDRAAAEAYMREVSEETELAALLVTIATREAPEASIPAMAELPAAEADQVVSEAAEAEEEEEEEEPAEEEWGEAPVVEEPPAPRRSLRRATPPHELARREALAGEPQPDAAEEAAGGRRWRFPFGRPARPAEAATAEERPAAPTAPPRPARRSAPSARRAAPPSEAEAAPTGRRRSSAFWAILLAVLIPLIVALLVAAFYWQQGRARSAELRELLDNAQTQIQSAAGLNDPLSVHAALDQASAFLDQAAVLEPNHPEIEQLRRQIQQELDKIDQVQPLYLVFTLKDFGVGDRDLSRVIVNGGNVFVLDRGRDQVEFYRLSEMGDSLVEEGQEPLLRKGQTVGAATVGELIDMVWVPAGEGRKASALLILDANGNLLQWVENLGLTAITISATDTWRSPQKLGTYFGRLYLMDTAGNTLLRYTPTENGYANPPEPYFAPEIAGNVDLSKAIDFAINGDIWILFADGRVIRFFQGKPQPFQLTGLSGQLRAPAALVAGLSDSAFLDRLFVGDAAAGRIIEFDKSGAFLRQMRPSEPAMFQEMRSLFLDEGEKAFYVLTATGLYKAQVPPSPS